MSCNIDNYLEESGTKRGVVVQIEAAKPMVSPGSCVDDLAKMAGLGQITLVILQAPPTSSSQCMRMLGMHDPIWALF